MFKMGISMVQVEPTTRCNLKCTYCTKKEPIRDLTVEVLGSVLDRHPNIKLLNLQGLGEPFLCPNITELCKYAKSRGMYVMTISNGTMLNYDALDYIDRVMISIDFLDEEKYNLLRPGAKWDFVMGELHSLGDMGKAGVNQVITHMTTRDDIYDMQEFCRTFGYALTQPRIENWGIEPDEMVKKDRDEHGIVPRRVDHCPWGVFKFYYDALGRSHPCCIRMNDEYVIDDIDEFTGKRLYHPICMRCPD